MSGRFEYYILEQAIADGMIDYDAIRMQVEMKENNTYLSMHPYAIWNGEDGKWYTYLPDDIKGRVFRKRKTKKEIEKVIIEYWREKEQNPTIKELFTEWLNEKVDRGEITKSTKDRYVSQFAQCFSAIENRHIKSISDYEIESFVLNSICENNLTRKGYSNLRTLLYGIFRKAKKKHMITYSITEIVKDFEISDKLFRKEVKSDDEEVFMVDEMPKVTEYLLKNQDILNLGILLLFKTGLRIGELVALKPNDISGNIIHVNRTEIRYKDEDGVLQYEVRDYPKTEAGIRDVIIPSNYLWIIKKIRILNPFGEYVFMQDGVRIRTYIFRSRLYTVCRRTDVVLKSPHKVRKTYGSILLDDGVAESLVISQMGHTDIKTTKNHYYRNRRNAQQIARELDKVCEL